MSTESFKQINMIFLAIQKMWGEPARCLASIS